LPGVGWDAVRKFRRNNPKADQSNTTRVGEAEITFCSVTAQPGALYDHNRLKPLRSDCRSANDEVQMEADKPT
jgi:hypothetical protein